jgi:hypothetical protein
MKTALIYLAVFIFLIIIKPDKKPIWLKIVLSIIPIELHYYYCGLNMDVIEMISAGLCLGMFFLIWWPSFFENGSGMPTSKTCQYCRSEIPWLSSKCKYCGSPTR